MSRENLEVVKSCLAARGRGDYLRAIGHFHPDVVVDLTARPDGQLYGGRRQAASAMRAWVRVWDGYVYEVERMIDAGDVVVVFFRERGRSKDSGVAVQFLGATVWTVRDGLVVRTKTYTDRKEALDAVGLRE